MEKGPASKKKNMKKQIVIGLIPEQNIFEHIKRYEPIAEYLSKKTGVGIKLKVITRYGNIVDNFVVSGLDGAFFGSFTYALAYAKIGVEVIARPEDFSGISSYHGLIFVRKRDEIRNPKDMKGKIFAFVDQATTAGYLFPLYYFKTHGIDDYKTFFKETYFAGTHEHAINDVLEKRADMGAAKNTVFERLAAKDIRITDELVILERSADVPENGLALRKDLDESIKIKLKNALLNMHNDPEGTEVLTRFGARKFIETKIDDYKQVYELAQKIGLELSRYDYMNE